MSILNQNIAIYHLKLDVLSLFKNITKYHSKLDIQI